MTKSLNEKSTLIAKHLHGISDDSDSEYIGDSCKPSVVNDVGETVTLTGVKPVDQRAFIPAVKQSAFVTTNLCDPEYAARYTAVVADALSMTKGQLQSRYPAEYNSLRSRRQQAKHRHIKFDDRLKDMRDWLIHIGPRPAEGFTVDRINTTAKGYKPGNLRWATKSQQTRNRKVTRWHQLPDGSRLTTKGLAKHLGLPYLTIYKRLRNGWTLDRLLQQNQFPSLESWRFPPDLARYCQPIYQRRTKHQQLRIDWFIGHFYDVLYNEQKLNGNFGRPGNAVTNITAYLEQARQDRANILQQQKSLEKRDFNQLLAIVDPPQKVTPQPQPPMKIQPPAKPQPAPEYKVAKTDNTLAWVAYNKLVNSRMKFPEIFSSDGYAAAKKVSEQELAAQGIFPPSEE